jgi:hypothetical protein
VSTDDTPPEPVPGRPHPALDRRRRDVARDRGRRRRRVVLGAIGAVVCVLAGYWLATGPVLTINGVTVKGYRGPDAAQLQSELAAAASHGGSLLSPPVDNMTAIAQRFPGVQTISVARAWPLGLTVTVVSAAPFADVVVHGERSVVVSNRGLVMGPVQGHTIRPTIDLSEPIPAFGNPLPAWAMQVVGFLEVIDPHTRPRIQGLTYAQGELTGHFIKGPLLILGTLDRMADKAVAVNAVLLRVSAKTFATKTYLDVTVPDRPALGTGAPPSAAASTSTSG